MNLIVAMNCGSNEEIIRSLEILIQHIKNARDQDLFLNSNYAGITAKLWWTQEVDPLVIQVRDTLLNKPIPIYPKNG